MYRTCVIFSLIKIFLIWGFIFGYEESLVYLVVFLSAKMRVNPGPCLFSRAPIGHMARDFSGSTSFYGLRFGASNYASRGISDLIEWPQVIHLITNFLDLKSRQKLFCLVAFYLSTMLRL